MAKKEAKKSAACRATNVRYTLPMIATGTITSLGLNGPEDGSAELLVYITDEQGKPATYGVYAPAYTFGAFASILSAAYVKGTKIDLVYWPDTIHTPHIYQVICPSQH